MPDVNYGWVCPLCGRALAPSVNECPCFTAVKEQEVAPAETKPTLYYPPGVRSVPGTKPFTQPEPSTKEAYGWPPKQCLNCFHRSSDLCGTFPQCPAERRSYVLTTDERTETPRF